MKKKTNIERMVMESHYLDALETESKASAPLSEMEREDFINQIRKFRSLSESQSAMLKLMALSLGSLNKAMAKKDDAMAEMKNALAEKEKIIIELSATIKRLEKDLRTSRDHAGYNAKNSFGSKSLKRRKKSLPKTPTACGKRKVMTEQMSRVRQAPAMQVKKSPLTEPR